jgi:hypothetical protein
MLAPDMLRRAFSPTAAEADKQVEMRHGEFFLEGLSPGEVVLEVWAFEVLASRTVTLVPGNRTLKMGDLDTLRGLSPGPIRLKRATVQIVFTFVTRDFQTYVNSPQLSRRVEAEVCACTMGWKAPTDITITLPLEQIRVPATPSDCRPSFWWADLQLYDDGGRGWLSKLPGTRPPSVTQTTSSCRWTSFREVPPPRPAARFRTPCAEPEPGPAGVSRLTTGLVPGGFLQAPRVRLAWTAAGGRRGGTRQGLLLKGFALDHPRRRTEPAGQICWDSFKSPLNATRLKPGRGT